MLAAVGLTAGLAGAAERDDAGRTSVRDIARLQGARPNKLIATSLVVGLKGTGDGEIAATVQSLSHMLRQFGHARVDMDGRDINADNVALVYLTATIPSHGARDGDRLDVRVSSINGAKSLKGGRLIQCPMLGPLATGNVVYALADGEVVLEDPASPTAGIVVGGAVMERDFSPNFIANGRITLRLDTHHAQWAVASAVARIVNNAEGEPGAPIAKATNPGEVVIRVPRAESVAPADFIARVLDLPVLMPDLKACIQINRRTGTIVITGDVRIGEVIVSQNGLTIDTMTPPPKATEENPQMKTDSFQVLTDDKAKASTSARRLVAAFNLLQVPVRDQIAVIRVLKRTGRLHAEVIEE